MDLLKSALNDNLQQKSTLKRKIDGSNIPFKKRRIIFSFDSFYFQNFTLPNSIIYYIQKNPASPKMYQKLIKCCKYFFVKNPILVSTSLRNSDNDEWSSSLGKIDMKKIVFQRCRFWITDEFYVWSVKNIVSPIVPKLYQCDLRKLSLENQIISYDDFIVLASSAEDISFYKVIVKHGNGSIVAFEKLMEVAAKVKAFDFQPHEKFSGITSNTMKQLIKIPNFFKLEWICLENVPEFLDLDAFYLYMKKNKDTNFFLRFEDSISVQYKNRLERIIDEILEDSKNNIDYYPPAICFSGLDPKKESKLNSLDKIYEKLKK